MYNDYKILTLLKEQVPKTAENFIELCRRESNGYIGSCFHRVIQDFVCQGGDYTKGDGTGGLSIYGGTFEDEDLTYRKHDQDCLLSMANKGPDTNGSQFFITSQPLPHLDGKHVVFGRLVSGQEDFRKMEAIETNEKDEPIEPLRIVNAGELRRKKVVDTVQDEDLVVPVEKVESPPPMEESDQEGEEEVNPYVIGVAPPPEVEAPSNFLLRDDRSRYSKPLYSRVDKDADGRKVKGRGSVVNNN